MPIARFWWYVRKKSLLKINSPDYVREKLAIAVSLLVTASPEVCRTALFQSGRCWVRTSDLLLVREAQRFAEGFQSLQNCCKYTCSRAYAFPEFSEH